jgi:hypothetical protein
MMKLNNNTEQVEKWKDYSKEKDKIIKKLQEKLRKM